ncbi:AzlD domain-containing protein [Endozoicomonas sp. SM1973]|uniref:AzlD domain-containing protein n=1 Tax=Spartinivicinus marinus TaxID=2994442 RepID=A0A853IEK0_9GAMM|nr:AzlD domain-containing protein [Spartinivicinus marinus]MCX4029196.1 AzlD domain-containing protein [Spartinivicinus marinus]NYZ65896.1 AzlD domain-containing protein [Spartinivicinus marinus]
MNEVILITGMAAVTFFIRYGLFAVAGRFHFPAWLSQALTYVPPAVLTAIIAPALLMPSGQQIELSLDNNYLIAGIMAILIAWFSKNLLATIVLGMAIFGALQWL